MATEKRDDLAEVRSSLRETWPSLTADDVAGLPTSRSEAAAMIAEKTNRPLDEVETALSGLFGLDPERQTPHPTGD